MEALRSHPFFASIRWDTLWDDPPPPLETGLARREPAPVDEWDDVGATWDELISGPDGSEDGDEDVESIMGSHPNGNSHAHPRLRPPGDDGIEWAPDAQLFVSPAIPPEEIGPHGEMPDYARQSLTLAEDVNGMDVGVDAVVAPEVDVDVDGAGGESPVGAVADAVVSGGYAIRFVPPGFEGVSNTSAAEDVVPGSSPDTITGPGPSRDPEKDKATERDSPVSTSTDGDGEIAAGLPQRTSGSLPVPRGVRDSYATSSSDGSPVEKLSAALEAMGIPRGRLRTRSPTPAREAPSTVDAPDWYVLYSFLPASPLPLRHSHGSLTHHLYTGPRCST